MVAGGAFVARAAFFSLRARQVDMNVLMTLAVVGAAAIGQWSEAGLVTFLFGLGSVLQVATLERTRRAIRGLMELTPADCAVLRDGAEQRVPAAEVHPGDVLVLRPGDRAAVDGVVVEGTAALDQAPVTGESAPAAKAPGDQVFAGSIVQGGTLRVRATTGAADNTIAKIVHLVEEAQAHRAPAQSMVDRFAARYTPVVVAAAAAVAFVPPLLGASFDTWFYRGLALLIISCPCALVISTPVSILAALARATRDGVLIKGGAYLERAAKLKAVAFDKTGTLTVGRPQVTDVVTLNGASADHVLTVAGAVERLSEHPLAGRHHGPRRGPGPAARRRLRLLQRRGPVRRRAGGLRLRLRRRTEQRGGERLNHDHDGHGHEDHEATTGTATTTTTAGPAPPRRRCGASGPYPAWACAPSWTAACTSSGGRDCSAPPARSSPCNAPWPPWSARAKRRWSWATRPRPWA